MHTHVHERRENNCMEKNCILSNEKLSEISGGKLINLDRLEAYIKERKEAGEKLSQIISKVVIQPNYENYTDNSDIFELIQYTTNYYNSLPGAKGSFTGSDVIDY